MNAEPLPHTPALRRMLDDASAIARRAGHTALGTEHLVLAGLQDPNSTVAQAFHRAGANLAAISDALHGTLRNGPYPNPTEHPDNGEGCAR
ncbi:Clp protease N-terminal domain-containing protein [Nocardia nova]|uniref:Clp protease N-terminal domain-containing protein n=1 Tax=Nocardia nova TaxID=37330 RepID=UPI0007A3B681|nr:Clp protease N-terminal domain-containing protein [Nocardia nova]